MSCQAFFARSMAISQSGRTKKCDSIILLLYAHINRSTENTSDAPLDCARSKRQNDQHNFRVPTPSKKTQPPASVACKRKHQTAAAIWGLSDAHLGRYGILIRIHIPKFFFRWTWYGGLASATCFGSKGCPVRLLSLCSRSCGSTKQGET